MEVKMLKKSSSKVTIFLINLLVFGFQLSILHAAALGDVNSSGAIDIVDALATAQYSVGLNPANFNTNLADVNADGAINIIDALFIAQFSVGVIITFPGSSTLYAPWDWAGVIGTGQSLAVGDHGTPVKSTTQPYSNLKLSTGSLTWPVDPNNSALTMVPLIEPVGRLAPNYPSSWPTNIAGETIHSCMGNQITALVQTKFNRGYISVQGNVGENGQCMTYLRKGAVQSGVNGRAYEATLVEVRAITRLAKAAGRTYGVAAITLVHGECDSGNTNYENDIYKLWSDYNTELKAITGQTQNLQMLVAQQNSQGDNSASTLAQWKVGVNHPTEIVCAGPTYRYNYASDGIHLTTDGYQALGEKMGQIYYERIALKKNWQPLQPTIASKTTRVITVQFNVPVAPLVWDNVLPAPYQNIIEWRAGRGFEVRLTNGSRITISAVAISGNSVQITCASDLPASGVVVAYAMTSNGSNMTTPYPGTLRWGQLRDSDPFVGSITKKALPNFCVAFELPVA